MTASYAPRVARRPAGVGAKVHEEVDRHMPRAIWSGSISFGLVNVPVKLFPAVHHQGLSFHQFQEGTNARVRNKRVSDKTGKEVAYEDIAKSYEANKGKYVTVDPDELAEFAPRATRTIDIEDFVALDDID